MADTTPPVLADHPDVTILSADPTGATLAYTDPTATDTQDPNPTVSCTPAAGTWVTLGTTTVTCTATDANGNTSAPKSFKVAAEFAASGTVSGTVPATLGLTLGAPASFGTFTPGLAQDYTATTLADVVSTAGDATLSVSDTDPAHPGHLVNGGSVMPQALQASAASRGAGQGPAFAPVSGSPLALLTWSGPVSNDQATVTFKQSVGQTDALRTGSYGKTLTFTLSTSTS